MTSPATILVVDDEPFNVDYLEQELDDLGYATVSAANGREALAQVEAHNPDAILLDIMMPELDGFGVLAALKGDARWRSIPVIVISANSDMASVVRGISLGAEDYLPKPFNEVLLRARIEASLEKKRLRDAEQLYLRGLERELQIGREIQAGFLPSALPQPAGWEVAARFRAAREVAGDFYDAFELPDGSLGLVIGDVCGKGVGAALFMTLFRSLLRAGANLEAFTGGEVAPDSPSPGAEVALRSALQLTNNYIEQLHGETSMFATIFFGALDRATGALRYINAGHELPLILGADGERRELKGTGPFVGVFARREFAVAETQLRPGDTLLAITDGVTDAMSPASQFFTRERLLPLLDAPAPSAAALLDRIDAALRAFVGTADPFDDITMIAVRRDP